LLATHLPVYNIRENNTIIFALDPHIKVSGEPTNVKKAKEKIMAVLDTKV